MTRKITLTVVLVLSLASTTFAATQRYMVVTRQPLRATSLRVATNSEEAARHRVRTFANVEAFAIDLTDEEASELRRSPDVMSLDPVVPRYALGTGGTLLPNASRYATQKTPWGITTVGAPNVWSVTRGKGVNVAVIDTGIELTHPDLVHAIAGGVNFVDSAATANDDHGHGTHVAGTIAAADNGFGVVGVAPEAKVWAVKILDHTGYGSDESVIAGIDWVISKKRAIGGSWVINMSIGAIGTSVAEDRVIQRAVGDGIVVVAAAGNGYSEFLTYPGAHRNVIAVGALDEKRNVAEFSNYGIGLNVVAPGVLVPSTVLPDQAKWASIELGSESIEAFGVTGSPHRQIRETFVDCKYGRPEDFPAAVAGKVAVMQRGPLGAALLFRDKAKNAKEAGALAVVLYNDDDLARRDWHNWTLITNPPLDYDFPLTVALSNADGKKLLANASRRGIVTHDTDAYAMMSGTSMATPHVVGVAALLLALDATANPADIEWAIENSTIDVNLPGWDFRTAWGMVDAEGAAKLLAPAAFGLPNTPPPSSRRRSVRP